MPFGLAPAPRLGTKLLAPVIRHLRRLGLRVSVYIDDIICLARSITRSIAHTQVAVDTLHYLGFSVHPEKCNLIPLRSQEFLGTQVNSKKMQFRVAREKIRNIRREIQAVFKANDLHQLTVRNLASLLGKLDGAEKLEFQSLMFTVRRSQLECQSQECKVRIPAFEFHSSEFLQLEFHSQGKTLIIGISQPESQS